MTNTYKTVDWTAKYNNVKDKLSVASWIPKYSGMIVGGANYALSARELADLGESGLIMGAGLALGKVIDVVGSKINEKRNAKGLEFEVVDKLGER